MINVTTQREMILPNSPNNRNRFLTEADYSFSLQACQDSYFTFIRPTQNHLFLSSVINYHIHTFSVFQGSRRLVSDVSVPGYAALFRSTVRPKTKTPIEMEMLKVGLV